jgi:monovalent cation:H+ antiporter-2, CPA2 family
VPHLPELIQDLAVILVTAAAVSLLFKRLRQPVVLGYLVAGLLVGPHISIFPTVSDTQSISIWAEIGVIFMLFGLGLEFSFKKLAKVGKGASISALVEVVVMMSVGFLLGRAFGWSQTDGVFLGAMLSISSTTIIMRAFGELNLKGRRFVPMVFGVLIAEDLIAILLLVALASAGSASSLEGGALTFSLFRLGFFLILWFSIGIYVLPTLLRNMQRLISSETLLVVSVGLCLMMVTIASQLGFSSALGAFVMGSILAETREGHRIETLIAPLKDLFSAIFFVSIGMLIQPSVLLEYWPQILIITGGVLLIKPLSAAFGSLLSGQPRRVALQTGMTLGQIGEFSFIIATLGATLGVTSHFLYPIGVAVSVITTFLTPYYIRVSTPLSERLEQMLSPRAKKGLDQYEAAMAPNLDNGLLGMLWKSYGAKILLNTVAALSVALGAAWLTRKYLNFAPAFDPGVRAAACALSLFISSPFLWAIVFGEAKHWETTNKTHLRRLQMIQPALFVFRLLIGLAIAAFIISRFTSFISASWFALGSFLLLGVLIMSRFSARIYGLIEGRFTSNLSERERSLLNKRGSLPPLAPWDAKLTEFTVSAHSDLIGKPLEENQLRERFGVTVALIERGDISIPAPKRNDTLYPGDRIFLIGTEEQVLRARDVIEIQANLDTQASQLAHFGLHSILLNDTDHYVDKSIRDCGLREESNGLIVGIERNGQRILNPDSSFVLRTGDLVWLVGTPTKK